MTLGMFCQATAPNLRSYILQSIFSATKMKGSVIQLGKSFNVRM